MTPQPMTSPKRRAGVDEPITITVPMPPNLANGRGHSRWISAAKKRYFAMLDNRQNCGLIPRPPEHAIERVVITSIAYVGMPNDSENMKFRAYKWPVDWLRTRGYIVNDNPAHCTMVQPSQVVKRGQVYRVELTLTPSGDTHDAVAEYRKAVIASVAPPSLNQGKANGL